jgi:hypothetical protein
MNQRSIQLRREPIAPPKQFLHTVFSLPGEEKRTKTGERSFPKSTFEGSRLSELKRAGGERLLREDKRDGDDDGDA